MRRISVKIIMMVILFAGVVNTGVCEDTQGDDRQGEGQQFQGFNLQGYTESGEKAWDVKGDTADILGGEIKLQNVDADTFGEEKMNVKAETGTINQTSGKMRLEKDVVITSEKGSQMMTDRLDWHRQEDLVTTDDDVTITDQNYTIYGTGMDAHPNLKTATIQKDVTALVDTDPDTENNKRVTITCDGPMVIDQGSSCATFEDNVVAVQEDQTLKADRMEVYFNEKMDQINSIVCIGNVEILKGDNKTYAERAVYEGATRQLTLTGRPKLIFITEGEGAITAFKN